MVKSVNGFFPGEIAPSTTVGGCIDIYENVWPNTNQTIERIENEIRNEESGVYWTRAETRGHGSEQNIRTNLNMGLTYLAGQTNNGVLQNVHNQFNMLLLATTLSYAERYGLHETLTHEPYSMLKYRSGQQYHAHYDGSSETGRVISAITYLNDDYEGGELEFPNFNIKIKPQAGMLILFPSNFAYTHIAHPVISGTKYALVTWIKDR